MVIIQHMWGTFGHTAFNVILRSSGALSIFRNLDLMLRDRRNILSGYESYTVRDRHAITLYINGKPCLESPMTASRLSSSDLERSKSRSFRYFKDLYLVVKELS